MQKRFSPGNQRGVRNSSGEFNKRGQFDPKRKRVCYFCSKSVEPDYKNVVQLKNYISDKGKILPNKVTKTCTKHQRRVAKAIKRSRMLALLSFVDKYRE